MKIAISAQGRDLNVQVDPRFGRCTGFIIFDTETEHFEAITNPGASSGSGAGIQAASTLIDKGVQVVLTGNIGPNAHTTLSAAGIEMYTGQTGSVADSIDRYRNGTLAAAGAPTVAAHHGTAAPKSEPFSATQTTNKVAVAAEDSRGLESRVSPHFGRAPYYAIVDTSGTAITSCQIVDNPFYAEHGSPGQVPSFINDQGAHVIISGGMGGRAVTFFEQYGIEPVTGAGGTVGESVMQYLKGDLSGTTSCKQTSCEDEDKQPG